MCLASSNFEIINSHLYLTFTSFIPFHYEDDHHRIHFNISTKYHESQRKH